MTKYRLLHELPDIAEGKLLVVEDDTTTVQHTLDLENTAWFEKIEEPEVIHIRNGEITNNNQPLQVEEEEEVQEEVVAQPVVQKRKQGFNWLLVLGGLVILIAALVFTNFVSPAFWGIAILAYIVVSGTMFFVRTT